MDDILKQSFELGFTYTRSTGPVVGRFLTGLRERQIFGVRGSDGRVLVPPMEYDPVTADPLEDFVQVAEAGEVLSWCWVSQPRPLHPWQEPFAWALIRLDGADVPLLHAITGLKEDAMHTGMRVRARWAEPPRGHVLGIASFVVE